MLKHAPPFARARLGMIKVGSKEFWLIANKVGMYVKGSNSAEDVEDAVQESAIKAISAKGSWEREADCFAWMKTAVSRCLVDQSRKRAQQTKIEAGVKRMFQHVSDGRIGEADVDLTLGMATESQRDAVKAIMAGEPTKRNQKLRRAANRMRRVYSGMELTTDAPVERKKPSSRGAVAPVGLLKIWAKATRLGKLDDRVSSGCAKEIAATVDEFMKGRKDREFLRSELVGLKYKPNSEWRAGLESAGVGWYRSRCDTVRRARAVAVRDLRVWLNEKDLKFYIKIA